MHADSLALREIMVFLVAAGVVVPLARRLKVSPVFAYLLIGLLIGPYGFARFTDSLPWLSYGVITDLEGVRPLAELGVVFLLFMIGLELSLDRLWALRRLVFGLGGAQVIVTGGVIAFIALQFGNSVSIAISLGFAFALSSTAMVMQLLLENRRLGTSTGRASFAILLCQDLAVLPILFLVGAFATESDLPVPLAFALAIGEALIAVVAILVIGRLLVRPLFQFVGSTASREMFLALVLVVIMGTALATEEFGLSMALGALLAGLLFAETEFRHEIEVDIEPFKGLLLGLFFVSVGMSIDIAEVATKPVWLIASVFGLYLVKSPIIYVLVRLFGESRPVALESGLLLGQGGEFAFVVIGMAYGLGLMPNDTAQFMLIVASLAMIVTPGVAKVARRLALAAEARELDSSRSDADIPVGLAGHVIVVGYGRVGQMLGSLLEEQEISHVGLDSSTNLVAEFRKKGAGVFYGDASHPDILRKIGVDQAAALVVTIDNPNTAEHIVATSRRHWPDLVIYARARDRNHAAQLVGRGASHVIPETIEASLQLAEMVLMGIGVPDNAARRLVEARRQSEQAAIDEIGQDGKS